jgi:hypothetical protein
MFSKRISPAPRGAQTFSDHDVPRGRWRPFSLVSMR